MTFTKRELWSWLKAESHHRGPVEKTTPNHNRASRRGLGQFGSHKWGASRRGAAKLLRAPLPWKEQDVRELSAGD